MVDAEAFLGNSTLMILIPAAMILIILLTLIVPPIRAYLKRKRSEKQKENSATKPKMKINFRNASAEILNTKNPNLAIRQLSSLIRKFLSQVFDTDKVLTYQEIKAKAESYCFTEIAHLCDVLIETDFATDNHSRQELEKLDAAFNNVLDLYEDIIIEDWQLNTTTHTPVNNRLLTRITSVIRNAELNRFRNRLRTNHPHLFKTGTEDLIEPPGKENDATDTLKLMSLARAELNKGDTQTADRAYSRILLNYNKLPTPQRRVVRSYVEELHKRLLNEIGLKASRELIHEIKKAVKSEDHAKSKQLFKQLTYIYDKIGIQNRKEVYRRWTAFIETVH